MLSAWRVGCMAITGKVNQVCNYPFYAVYRTAADSQNSKIDIKEFLDKLGKWLEKQIGEDSR